MQANFDIDVAQRSVAIARWVAQAFAFEVRAHFGDRLRRVKLYGSAARGDFTPDSDIDVLVLLDRLTTEDEEWLTRRAFALGVLQHGIVLQPIFMTEADFANLQARERRFAVEIEAEGITL